MPAWAQDLAALTTVALAAAWLIARWFRIGRPASAQVGCARCDHNPVTPARSSTQTSSQGIRSAQLRVLD